MSAPLLLRTAAWQSHSVIRSKVTPALAVTSARCVSHMEVGGKHYRYEKWHRRNPAKKYPNVAFPNRVPGADFNLQERLDMLYSEQKHKRENRKDIGHFSKVGEGSSSPKERRQKAIEWRKSQRADPELERAARMRTLDVDLDAVAAEHLDSGGALTDIRDAADLYGVFDDLFGDDAYFTPATYMEVRYPDADDADLVTPVHRGNVVKPREAAAQPEVAWQAEEGDGSLWTMVMTTPDGHFKDENAEYLHWMVGNIRGDDIATGTTLCDYLQPFPPFGAGYFRYVFVLYKQNREIDFGQPLQSSNDLSARTFKTSEFYARHKDDLVPSGLAFFQSDYDSGVREVYHSVLNMKEPRYEYHFTQPYYRDWSSNYQPANGSIPFDHWLNMRRDPKEIQQEVVVKKLQKHHPFSGDEDAEWKYPNLMEIDTSLPKWRRREIERERLRGGYFKDMDWMELRRDPDTHA